MWWLSLLGRICTIAIGLWAAWLMLLAYRVVGKPAGQDASYDAYIKYWSGTFKVIGALGLVCVVLEVIEFVVSRL
jgi:hypothetical protein